MNSNVKQVLEAIPDFSEFLKLTDEIGELSFKKLIAEKEIKQAESVVVQRCMNEERFFIGGKPPSMAYVKDALVYTGVDGEIIPLREKLADITAMLEKRKLTLSVYKDMLEVWRTLSANERSTQL